MAKVNSIITLNGTIGDLIFYQMNGKTYVRSKPQNLIEQMKHSPSYEGYRNRQNARPVTNSLATAIYRIGKEYATAVNYKIHNELYQRIFPVVKAMKNGELDWGFLQQRIKGTVLNHRDSNMMVHLERTDKGLLINHCSEIDHPLEVTICIGDLPALYEEDGIYKAAIDAEEVQLIEFCVMKGVRYDDDLIPMKLKDTQVVIVIEKYFTPEYRIEWVRVV
ncbi:MAG: hypothetical protein H6600_03725 [Flavobacteriales bacterium]|nr:hypothetical protein [Flavobacteriales bacterium]